MSRRRNFDLVIIGAEAAGLAAAACAARQGARVALIHTGDKPPRAVSSVGIPDFVWRKLNLHESGLDAKPVSARISLFEDGEPFATYADAAKTCEALEAASLDDRHLWTDFNADLERVWEEGQNLMQTAARRRGKNAPPPLFEALAADPAAGARMSVSSKALLDDYLGDARLKTHLSNVALSPFGLGGDEAGSALALASLTEPAAWRLRPSHKGPRIERVLEDAALAASVEILDARIRAINPDEEKFRLVALHDGEVLRTRHLMAASREAAARADVDVAPAFSPHARRDGAVADIRIRFSKPVEAPANDKDAIYFVSDSPQGLAEARDAAIEGRLIDRPPISFEFQKDEIVVVAPYCPAFLISEGEVREWTEQDRQALGRIIVSRLEPYLNGVTRAVRRVDVRVLPAAACEADKGGVVAPPPSHDPVGAAAKLALDLIGGE